jgi:hypothetical protein
LTEHNPRAPRSEDELLELVRSIDERAPAHLHERIQAMAAEAAAPRRRAFGGGVSKRWRLGWAATAVAAILAALVLALAGGGGAGPSLGEASALALRAPDMPAPTESVAAREQLNAAVDGIPFPYWKDRFGWQTSGQREDNLYGRKIRTVYYSNAAGLRIGYAIVAGRPAPGIGAGAVHWRNGTPYKLTSEHGAPVVTWTRDGHLCIVSGRGVPASTLLALASWDERSRVA